MIAYIWKKLIKIFTRITRSLSLLMYILPYNKGYSEGTGILIKTIYMQIISIKLKLTFDLYLINIDVKLYFLILCL